MKALYYTIRLEPMDEGGFMVSVPALPGCYTFGDDYDHAFAMAEEAIQVWVESLALCGEPVPIEPVPHEASVILRVHPQAVA